MFKLRVYLSLDMLPRDNGNHSIKESFRDG